MNSVLLRVKEVIKHVGLSDSAFSKRIGVKQTTFSGLFQRDVVPRADMLIDISNEYKVNPTWLLTGEGNMFFDSVQNEPNQNVPSKDRTDELIERIDWMADMMEARGMLADDGKAIRVTCPLCHVVNKLDHEHQIKALGYAEALLHDMNPKKKGGGYETFDPEPEYSLGSASLPYAEGIAAGEPHESFFDYGVYKVDRALLEGSLQDYVAVRVSGTSMVNADIPDDSVVIIRKGQPLISGKIYLVRHEGAYTLKRYIKDKDGTQRLAYDDGTGRSVVVEDGDYQVVGRFCFVAE